MSNVTELKKDNCTGCSLCMNICPQSILSMTEDDEGFIYPMINSSDKCINCGKCLRMCPVVNREYSKPIQYSKANYVYNLDNNLVKRSSSGGVAYGLYTYFLAHDHACAIGVRYTHDCKNVEYSCAHKIELIDEFLGSKYVKANTSQLISDITQELNADNNVIFIGLPCEVSALRNYFGDHDKLYLVELICHGPSSHFLLEKYVESIEEKTSSKVICLTMRFKNPDWKPYFIKACLENGSEHLETFVGSSFSDGFQIFKRPSCNNCKFKDGHTNSDLIIGDFHAAEKGLAEYNRFGVSIAFSITDKGQQLLSMLKESGFAMGSTAEWKAKGNYALIHPVKKYIVRKWFITRLLKNGMQNADNDLIVRASLKLRIFNTKITEYIKKIKRLSTRKKV